MTVGPMLEAGGMALGIPVSASQSAVLERYVRLVLAWRARLNLSGAATEADAARVLVLGGMACLPYVPSRGTIVDVGSGSGSPGVPVAVLRPDARIVLVEASRRKAAFLGLAVRELGLANAEVLHARAEDVGRDPRHRGRYDGATARAVARLPVLFELVLPLVRAGGAAVVLTGARAKEALAAAAHVARLLGGEGTVPVPGVIVVRKVAETPPRFPRRPGVPARRPLGRD